MSLASKVRQKQADRQKEKAPPEHLDDHLNKTGSRRSLSSVSPRIINADQLLAHCEIDTTIWEIERQVVNKWEVGAKVRVNDVEVIAVEPLFQVKVWLKRHKESESQILIAIREFSKSKPSYPKIKFKRPKGDCLLEVSIPDLHIGKLAWAPEVGEDYDVKIACQSGQDAIDYFIERASHWPVKEILFPFGNDLLNTDNGTTTTSGTHQDEDGRWQYTFRAAWQQYLIPAIDKLRQIAPVRAIAVPGNHDLQRVFYLGEVLAAHYRGEPNITINNQPGFRKYIRWGKTLLLFTHRWQQKGPTIADSMATEKPVEFAECDWKIAHLGHLHHSRRIEFMTLLQERCIEVEIIPSLSGTDAYHSEYGYSAHRAAKCFLYHEDDGPIGTFAYRIKSRP